MFGGSSLLSAHGATPLEEAVGLHAILALSVAVCTLGLGGMLATRWFLSGRFHRTRDSKLSLADLSILDSPVVQDGALQHRSIPMERWCVTRHDLAQLRRLVERAIRDGRILPTVTDPFDPTDNLVGPSVYTVTSQFVAPVTLAAGGASWALMLHPGGLPCDLFVTHSWAEGIYEFIDKVMHSWPPGTQNAYCCMLSNPQNLCISELVASPVDSPFASAMRRATHVLVVPNRTVSIYTRMWCAYEAFLGYNYGKLISTASPPMPGFWAEIIQTAFAYLLGLGVGTISVVLLEGDQRACFVVGSMVALIPLLFAWFCVKACHFSYVLFILQMAGVLNVGFLAAGLNAVYPGYSSLSMLLMFAAAAVGGEADRQRCAAAAVQEQQLQRGFTGHLMDAQCSVPADAERIRQELRKSGCEAKVDEAVEVLIRMGMSSPQLCQAAALAGPLGDVSRWRRAGLVGGFIAAVTMPLFLQDLGSCQQFQWPAWVAVAEGCLLFGLFAGLPRDRKALGAAAQQLMVFPVFPVLLSELLIFGCSCGTLVLMTCCLTPLTLALSAAGPARIARLPLLGPALVRFLLGAPPKRKTWASSLASWVCLLRGARSDTAAAGLAVAAVAREPEQAADEESGQALEEEAFKASL